MEQLDSSDLKAIFENDWHDLPLIKSLSALAALFHDWGKASALFQDKLKKSSKEGDPVRHEWISCLLLHAFIKMSGSQDDDIPWLKMLIEESWDEEKLKDIVTQRERAPLVSLPPAAKLISWLVVSHHRLPVPKDIKEWRDESAVDIDAILKRITKEWNYENESRGDKGFEKRLRACFDFPHGLLSQSSSWVKQLKKWAQHLQEDLPKLEQYMTDGGYRLLLHHARLCLMLGDHYYSSQDADLKWGNTTGLFANTDKKTREVKQKLDEHLVGVSKNALRVAHLLPAFEQELPVVQGIRSLRKTSPSQYSWQDQAVKEIRYWREQEGKKVSGCFVVNMASTGCGKTFANAKVMRALSSDGDSLRYILALGLRTLTLQTGDEYRERIGLDNSELAVLIGSKAIQELHNQKMEESRSEKNEQVGSESLESLLDEDIDYACDIPEEGLVTVLIQQKDRQFLYAPVLACTIDHLMAATETQRGGRYILPCLRLMSSDLVIDEVDDFTGSDLIAIGRLIHLAGMLGRKVMISSATIPPDLAEGYFNAYRSGWQLFSQTRNVSSDVGCAWIDEFKTMVKTIKKIHDQDPVGTYRVSHNKFVTKRVEKLRGQPALRKATIIECQSVMDGCSSKDKKREQYFEKIKQAILEKHQDHFTKDQKTDIAVSFGVVRVANIGPCADLTRYLIECEWPDDVDIKVMAYHSQQVLLLRHEQEKHLDSVLKRKEKPDELPQAFNDHIIRRHLDQSTAQHMIFILVATPVEEVGRDHDFDWAIIEPSSYRSIVQLSGRVRRHRKDKIDKPNIGILQYNLKALKAGKGVGERCFYHPGYEEKLTLNTHDLSKLIDVDAAKQSITAIPRILKPEQLNERGSLSGLEHFVIHDQLTQYNKVGPESLQGYLTGTWYLTALPQVLNPFRKGEKTTRLFLKYEPDEDHLEFIEKDESGNSVERENIYGIKHCEAMNHDCEKKLWLPRKYKELLEGHAESQGCSPEALSLRYGELSFVYRDGRGYVYSDDLGLIEKERENT